MGGYLQVRATNRSLFCREKSLCYGVILSRVEYFFINSDGLMKYHPGAQNRPPGPKIGPRGRFWTPPGGPPRGGSWGPMGGSMGVQIRGARVLWDIPAWTPQGPGPWGPQGGGFTIWQVGLGHPRADSPMECHFFFIDYTMS